MMSEPTSAGSTTAQAAETTLPAGPLDVTEVMRILPHRYPFLLVDRVLEMRPGYIVGQKCVSVNEPFFQGHFPSKPVMPGVLQIEAIAQVGAVLEGLYPDRKGKLLVLAGIDEARFRRLVVPGDVLRIECEEVFRRKSIGRTKGRITVDGEVACEAVITFGVQSF